MLKILTKSMHSAGVRFSDKKNALLCRNQRIKMVIAMDIDKKNNLADLIPANYFIEIIQVY